jgi:hsp70-interacting protein
MATSGGPNWLGLLQWSLAHSDGTRPTSEVQKMGDEDKKWLEAVMKDSVKDEPARMNQIMTEIVAMLDSKSCCENEERIEIMLDELRDITEQIDMAQIFVR